MPSILAASNSGSTGDLLPSASVWKAGALFASFFTLESEDSRSHYTNAGKRSYLCLGEGCPACAVGERVTSHKLLPFWNLKTRRVEVLLLQTTPGGPRDRLIEFLRIHEKDLAKVIARITSFGDGDVCIKALTPNADTDRGALACAHFAERLEAGEIHINNCFARLTSDEIAKLPEVAAIGQLPPVGEPELEFAEYEPSGDGEEVLRTTDRPGKGKRKSPPSDAA